MAFEPPLHPHPGWGSDVYIYSLFQQTLFVSLPPVRPSTRYWGHSSDQDRQAPTLRGQSGHRPLAGIYGGNTSMTLTVRQPSTRERVWPSPALLSEVWGTGIVPVLQMRGLRHEAFG